MKKMRKIFAVLLTLAMVLGMSMTSFAAETTAPSAADKATITVTGIENGATVKAYRIVEPQYNEHGLYGYKVVSPYSIADTINFTPTFKEITTIAKQVSGTAIDLTGNLTNGYTATVGAGEYIVIIESTNYTYNPVVVSAAYTNANNKASLANGTIAATDTWTLTEGKSVAKSSEVKIEKTVSQPDAAVGDKVDYTINGTIPSYGPQFENPVYKITDTITNAKYASDITVTIGGEKATAGTDYTITGGNAEDSNFEISFTNVGAYYNKTDAERAVVITYKAEILASATSIDPAKNTAKLTYSNKPGSTKDATEKKTYTYTFELDDEFTKVDENGNPLDGCTFTLTNKNTKKVYTCTTKNVDGKAKIHFEGLDAGEYTLVETVAKDGYSINNTKYTVVITPEYNTDGTLKSKTITIDGKTDKVVVRNTEISALPSTGGIGTTIFTIAGCVIMIAAAGLFFASRKKSDNK